MSANLLDETPETVGSTPAPAAKKNTPAAPKKETKKAGTTPAPAAAAPPAEPKEPKVYSRTELFQLNLQATINESLNVKISRKAAWELFKGIVSCTVGDVVQNGRLPLQGVGTFEIKEARPRKSKVFTHKIVPRFRFRPGTKINDFLEKTLPNVFMSEEESQAAIAANPELYKALQDAAAEHAAQKAAGAVAATE